MTLEIRPADWTRERAQIRSVREAVFVREQQVAPDIEWDDQEDSAQHFLVLRDGVAIGTGRLLPSGKIGRMAILKIERGSGLGARLLVHICEFAQRRGATSVYLHAQCHAEDFYRKAGFLAEGEVFSEANIPHVKMVRHFA